MTVSLTTLDRVTLVTTRANLTIPLIDGIWKEENISSSREPRLDISVIELARGPRWGNTGRTPIFHVEPIDSRSFSPKTYFFGHFGDFQPGNGPNLRSTQKLHLQHDSMSFLSTSPTFYDIFSRACPEKVWDFGLFVFFLFFFLLLFSFSWFFAAVVDLLLGLLPVQKIRESVTEMGKLYHGVSTRSRRQFCSEFFSQISERLLANLRSHWADHFDLGIVGKIFSSCRNWVQMMSILVKCDKVRRETNKANPGYGHLLTARESMG